MSIHPDERQLQDAIINAFKQFDQAEAQEKLYTAIEQFLTGIDPNEQKYKFHFENPHGLENIRFLNKQFRTDLTDLASKLREIDTAKRDLRHQKCDEALTLMSTQVEKGNVIYQVTQKQGKILAAASENAAQTYQDQRAERAKAPKIVHTLSAQTQADISKKIKSTFSSLQTPAKMTEDRARADVRPQMRKAEDANAPTMAPTAPSLRKEAPKSKQPVTQHQTEQQGQTAQPGTSEAARKKEQRERADQRQRDKTEAAETRQEHIRDQGKTR